jgi:hypothetical protein
VAGRCRYRRRLRGADLSARIRRYRAHPAAGLASVCYGGGGVRMSSWSIWCPHWVVDEHSDQDTPLWVGAQPRMPIGFIVDQWRDAPTDEVTWELVGPGVYCIENAPVVHTPTESPSVEPTWDLMLGPLRLSTDAWKPETFERAKALEVGDHISGRVTVSLDPTHEGYRPALRVTQIQLREPDDTAWEQVSRVGSARTRLSDRLSILVTCELSETD